MTPWIVAYQSSVHGILQARISPGNICGLVKFCKNLSLKLEDHYKILTVKIQVTENYMKQETKDPVV